MENLEIELEKLRKTVEDHPNILSQNLERYIEIPLLLAMGENNLKRASYRLLSDVFNSDIGGIFRERKDGSIKIYNPRQLFTRLRVNKVRKRKRDLKDLGLKRFNIDVKNFIVHAYKIIYDAYIRPKLEQQQKEKQRSNQAEYEKNLLHPGCSTYPGGLN